MLIDESFNFAKYRDRHVPLTRPCVDWKNTKRCSHTKSIVLTSIDSFAYAEGVSAKSDAGIDLLQTKRTGAYSMTPFFVPAVYGGSCGGSSERRPLVR